MVCRFVAFAAFVAVARASGIGLAAPLATTYAHAPLATTYAAPAPVAYAAPIAKTIVAEPSAPAHYDFAYGVNDPWTGDSKSQVESRRGDFVQGSYSLVDSDGTKRTVDYAADPHNGFNAVVRKEPLAVAVKTVAPVVHAAPVAHAAPVVHATYAAPAAYAAPVAYAAQTAYAAPAIAKFAAPALTTSYATNAVHSYAAAAPAIAKFAAPALTTSYATNAVHSYAAAAPAIATSYAAPYGHPVAKFAAW